MEKKEPRCFSDSISAYLFFKEYAKCQLTGRNLWLLDSGIMNWDSVQIDHVIPWSKNGKTDLSNAALLSGTANYNASDTKNKIYNSQFGFPTSHYFYENNLITDKTKSQLLKFVRLLPSDFYFNRALESFLFGLEYRREPKRVTGKIKDRDDKYYARSVINWLKKWNDKKEKNWDTFENRKIINIKMLEVDQQIMLKVRDANSKSDVLKLYDELEPYYFHLYKCHRAFYKAYDIIIYNFVLASTFDSAIKLDDYVEKQFADLLKLIKNKNTLPRYKVTVLDTIDFLKTLCLKIAKYRFSVNNNNNKQKANFYIGTYKNIMSLKKNKNDFYIQATEKILKSFPNDLIDLNAGFILDLKGNEKNWLDDVSDFDIEFLINQISLTEEIDYYFLINDNDTHRKLLKDFLSVISDKKIIDI